MSAQGFLGSVDCEIVSERTKAKKALLTKARDLPDSTYSFSNPKCRPGGGDLGEAAGQP